MTRVTKIAFLLMLGIGLLAFLAACNLRKNNPNTTAHPYGGSVQMLIYPPLTLDPANNLSVYESFIVNQIHEGLVELDEGLEIEPALSNFWTIDSSFTTFTFQIRPHVTFHGGEMFIAQDAKASFERLIRRDHEHSTSIHHFIDEIVGVNDWLSGKSPEISGIKVIDGSHIQFKLLHSTPDFLYFFASDPAKIMIKDRHNPDQWDGAGPFYLGHQSDSLITLLPFENYYHGRPYLDSINLILDDNGTEEMEYDKLLAHELNFIECPLWGIDTLSTIPWLSTQKRLGLEFDYVGIRTDHKPLDDKSFRQTLYRSIDWDQLDEPDLPYFQRAQGVIPPGLAGYRPDLVNPLKSEQKPTTPLKISPDKLSRPFIYGVTDTLYVDTEDDVIVSAWEKLGLNMEWPVYSWNNFDRALEAGTMDFFVMGWVVEVPSTPRYLYNLFHSRGVGNYFGYHNSNVDRLIEEAIHATSSTLQVSLCQAVEDSIMLDLPVIPSSFVFTAYAYDAKLRGVKLSELGYSTLQCEEMWFEK